MRPTLELITTYPVLIAIVLFPPLLTFLFGLLSNRRENMKIVLKHIDIANAILKPTLSTSNKKQIYLTEQLFRSTYKHPFNYDEITSLLSCRQPSKAIEQFLLAKKFLEFSTADNSFIEKKGNIISIYGKSPAHTGVVIVLRYFVFASLGALLGNSTLKFISSLYVDNSAPIDAYFMLAVILMALSLALIVIALKDLSQTGNKTIANEFLDDNYPKSEVKPLLHNR